MDIDLATLDGIVKSAGFAIPLLLFVLWKQDKRLTNEITDRREAWSKYNGVLTDFNELTHGVIKSLDSNTSTLSVNTKTLEAFRCKYSNEK